MFSEPPVIRLSVTEEQPSPASQEDDASTIITAACKTSAVPALQEKTVEVLHSYYLYFV